MKQKTTKQTSINDIKNRFFPFKSEQMKEKYHDYYAKMEKLWPIKYETKYVDTEYGLTYVRICGSQNAPSLVLLPGDTECSLVWNKQIEKLSKHYQVFMPDQINDYGLSVRTKAIKGKSDFVAWLDNLFNKLKINNINLVGYSYGGGLAIAYAISHSENIKKLVLLAPASRSWPIRIKVFLALMIQDILWTKWVIKKYVYWENKNAITKDEETRKVVDDKIDEIMLDRECFLPHKWILPFSFTSTDWNKIKAPIYTLIGENDILVPAEKVYNYMKRKVLNSKTEIITEAGHDLLIVKSGIVCEKILSFITN